MPATNWRDGFGAGSGWYRNEGNPLWAQEMGEGYWKAGVWVKSHWLKPVGSRLTITGRRLDGEATLMVRSFIEGYPGDFEAAGLLFPAAGCWEIDATADDSTLRFVVFIPGTP
ncbi:MAG: hypothetical protein HY532_04625 [Chloroflexi bacterium]|nr:hypothetical protein [Chloroflexota bacterium]